MSAATSQTPLPASPSERKVVLRGGNAEMFNDTAHSEVLLCGPAGSGKSLAALARLHHYCSTYPNVRCLLVRKTRKSLSESALVTFESIAGDYRKFFSREKRAQRSSYDYPNGSTIVIGGMDDPVKIMSTDFDLIYVQESIELLEDDWEALTTRLRNGKLQFQQLFGDTNPSYPTHWLRKRCFKGKTKLYNSVHEDNPAYFNIDGSLTPSGAVYISKLDALSGARKDRLRYGQWVSAEGRIYDNWNASIHVIDPFPIPASWKRYIAVDFGFRDPLVALWAAADEDGRLYIYREFYQTEVLVENLGRFIRSTSNSEPPPQWVVCDHDLGARMTLEKYMERRSIPADKKRTINQGIEIVRSRLNVKGDGFARLYYFRNALVYRDEKLGDELKKPTSLIEEVESYVWKDLSSKEEPQGGDDHSLDCLRYLCVKAENRAVNMEVTFIG